jgi:hypothetical protein
MPPPTSYTIDKVAWHTRRPGNPETIESIHNRFRIIIDFLQENQLTHRVILNSADPIADDVSIRTDDLNGNGMALMKACYHKWLGKVDRGMNPKNLSILEKFVRDQLGD